MIHNDIQNQLQLLIKTSAPPLIDVADHAAGSPQWTPGQRLPAHVLANLPNGRFEVRVGDQVLDLNLPRNTQVGDNVELVFVGNKPRLTFALSQDIANLSPAKTPVALSETAKFIGSLIQKSTGDAQAATQAARTAPVVPRLPASTADFAQSLRQAVTQSGLFYESHQAQWVGGERNIASLLQEPQGQLSPLLSQARNNPAQPSAPTQMAGPESVKSAEPGRGNALSADQSHVLKTASEPVHPQTTPLIQQQLLTLDTRQVLWQGQVWPGQEMTWEIEEEGTRNGGDEAEAEANWQTRLNLQLPVMGGVTAKIAFSQGAVRLDISAERSDSAERMRSRQALLSEAFASSGLSLAGVSIRNEPT